MPLLGVELNSSTRIAYESKRLTTGLTDITINIWNPSGTQVVSGASLSELGNGIYYYDYTPTSTGVYIFQIDSVSQPRTYIDSLRVQDTATLIEDNATRTSGGGDAISADIAYTLKILADNILKKDDVGSVVYDTIQRASRTSNDVRLTNTLEETNKQVSTLADEFNNLIKDSENDKTSLVGSLALFKTSLNNLKKEISIYSEEQRKYHEVTLNSFNSKLDSLKEEIETNKARNQENKDFIVAKLGLFEQELAENAKKADILEDNVRKDIALFTKDLFNYVEKMTTRGKDSELIFLYMIHNVLNKSLASQMTDGDMMSITDRIDSRLKETNTKFDSYLKNIENGHNKKELDEIRDNLQKNNLSNQYSFLNSNKTKE